MPAYRSSAEAEVRDAVVACLRQIRPEARIMHEVNCSLYGPNRIDVIAVSRAEIISVEVKSAKDKIDRLPAQIASMKTMSHHVIVALHEKHCVEAETNQWSAHYSRDGKFWRKTAPPQANGSTLWMFPMPETDPWRPLEQKPMRANIGALDMLWADEMRLFCRLNGIACKNSSTREGLYPQIKWRCTGEQITKGVCAILRQRVCPEADAPIAMEIAA